MRKVDLRLWACVAALAFVVPASQALPVVATATFTVSASVPGACSFVAAPTNMAFGVYSGAALNAQSDMSILCTNGTAVKIFATPGVRQMAATPANGSALTYQLFSDATRATVFPSTYAAGFSLTGTGSNQAFTIYGRIPAGQTVNPGNYSQTVTLTIEL